jgi:glycosyltransferase involved in cell wall biosynthesis
MARVSVVVPTCRRPVMLQRALRSVAAQLTRPSEVIVVDDGPKSERRAVQRAVSDVDLPDVRLVANARGKGALTFVEVP